jgi:hypothetical protein
MAHYDAIVKNPEAAMGAIARRWGMTRAQLDERIRAISAAAVRASNGLMPADAPEVLSGERRGGGGE